METKILKTLKNAKSTLDRIADTFGVKRATNISLLGGDLLALEEMLQKLLKENAELKAELEKCNDGNEATEAEAKEVP